MSDIFGMSAFLTQKALSARGIEVKRAIFHEFYASFFGYHHKREMEVDMDDIVHCVTQCAPLIVLQNHAAYLRMAELLKEQVRADQLQPVFDVIKGNLLNALPVTTYDDESHLLYAYVAEEVKRWLFDESNEPIAEAQGRVAAACGLFRPDDLDFPTLIYEHGPVWEGTFMAMLYRSRPDGTPAYDEDQIATNTFVRAEKLGRVLLDRNLYLNSTASPFTPHPGMGGIPL